jgi:hypothetical protein
MPAGARIFPCESALAKQQPKLRVLLVGKADRAGTDSDSLAAGKDAGLTRQAIRDVCACPAGAARSPSSGCSAAISAAPSALAAAMALPGPSSKRRAGKTGKRGGGQHQARLLLLVLPPCHGPRAGIGNPYGHRGVIVQRSPRRLNHSLSKGRL